MLVRPIQFLVCAAASSLSHFSTYSARLTQYTELTRIRCGMCRLWAAYDKRCEKMPRHSIALRRHRHARMDQCCEENVLSPLQFRKRTVRCPSCCNSSGIKVETVWIFSDRPTTTDTSPHGRLSELSRADHVAGKVPGWAERIVILLRCLCPDTGKVFKLEQPACQRLRDCRPWQVGNCLFFQSPTTICAIRDPAISARGVLW